MSFPRYPAYKPSGVEWLGDVPEHWEVKPLKFNLRLLTEKTDRRERPVALENIEGWTGRFIPTETEFQGEGVAFEAGDILFGKLRPYLAKAYLAESGGEAVGDFHVMRPAKGMNGRFAQYQILNREFISIVDGSTFGSKMPRASWEFVAGMKLPSPPLAEQTAIAAFLDRETGRMDALVAEQRRLMELLKEKRQAVISHAVTRGLNPQAKLKPSGIEWLGEVPEDWEVKKLFYLLSEPPKNGVSPDVSADGTIPTFSIAAVRSGVVDIENHLKYAAIDLKAAAPYFVRLNDIFVLRGNGSKELVGTVGMVNSVPPPNCIYPDILIRLRPNELVNPLYLVGCFNCSAMRPQIENAAQTAAGIWKINGGSLQALRLPLPPLAEQTAIVAHLERELAKFDTLTAEAQRAIDLLQERRSALISAAVTGQIDVRAMAEKKAL